MQEFMRIRGSSSQTKLFRKVKSVHLQITNQKFTEMESALRAVGYTHHSDHFMHEHNPKVYYIITETNTVPKYKRIEIELSAPTAERKIQLGNMYSIHIKGNEMVIEQINKGTTK